jgi:hypothetical protein
MIEHRVTETARVAGSRGDAYRVLGAYRDGHPGVLPPRYSRAFEVGRGGTGSGTVLRLLGGALLAASTPADGEGR